MLEKLIQKLQDFKELLLKEENTWMWSVVAIFALLFTALLLVLTFVFSEEIPK